MQGARAHSASATRGARRLRTVQLACGILASLLYVATDIAGGVIHGGYSFFSQAISELMATGAPSERFVDPLFIAYAMLALTFGFGVFREGTGRSRALRIAGAMLMAYAVLGAAGPTLFEMRQRGAGSLQTDLPHIVLTGVLSLLTFVAIGFGAAAFGGAFQRYSLFTIILMLAFGGLAAPYGADLAAGLPTPGLGLLERVSVYLALAWMATLAVTLMRRVRQR